jgi:hypothetical protein
MSYTKDYDTPDEKLSYFELKDRIREECARVLPRKERILLAAKKLEDDLTLKDTICDQICSDLGDVTSERYIRKCLPDEYKQQKKRRKQSTSDLRNRSANDDKNVPEKKAMAVDASTGYEEPFKDIDRPNIESASEIEKNLQKKRENVSEDFDKMNRGHDVVTESKKIKKLGQRLNEAEEERMILRQERDELNTTVKVLKEKTTPELLHELQEKFADTPGLLDAKKLEKISMEAGKHLVTLMKKYNAILQEAVECGKPVPIGTYIITKPQLKLVPVNILVDFDRRKIQTLLREKRLQGLS